ncbi:DUF3823 domain-containing protein [Chitinophaga sp. NPDC101104]|uniref:DUF3823 domain-containing protein n=1 Tax=Chitinophaga sp. NPDC101104 TaxID=3390561 RepID=UPI003D0337C0
MKKRFAYILPLLAVLAASCKKDNYDPPQARLHGRLVYQGQGIPVEYNQVPFQLYQFGFGKVGPVSNTTFTQEGTFSVLLFEGDYKLTVPNGQGPFLWKKLPDGRPDSIAIKISGDQQLDLEVTPFYMIRNVNMSAASGKVTATFALEKIVNGADGKNVERVNLYINKTAFVSSGGDYSIASSQKNAGAITDPASVSMEVTVPALVPAQSYIFARVGLKLQGVEDMIFSPVTKINL